MFRLLLPFIGGILLQWYGRFPIQLPQLLGLFSAASLVFLFSAGIFYHYQFLLLTGIAISISLTSIGMLLTCKADARNDPQWFARSYRDSSFLLVILDQQPVEKTKSIKTEATACCVFYHGKVIPATGRLILYFKKETYRYKLTYGSRVILKKPLQEIRNTGNPADFDYKQYALFHGITHQAYLQPDDYAVLPGKKQNKWNLFIYSLRERILATLRRYINPRKELGLSEALLMGYKDDLDKTLVQSYSHTGVVHIIAISGLHLGLIYWLLLKLLYPLQKRKKLKWLRPVLVICGLWVFTCLAGAQPSVLRSALMFTCIATGEGLTRKTSIFNSLSLSAFLLLCYDPYWLWDVGFQLSYAAVISIVLFSRPVYHLFCFHNRIIDQVWKLNAVTISAQILTIPVCLFYFHQFPNYFLLTNMVAVPLSGIILSAEILLCSTGFIPLLGLWTGKIITWLVWLMNSWIEKVEALPFSLWNGLQITLLQAFLLTAFIAAFSKWLLQRNVTMLRLSLSALFIFCALRSYSFIKNASQQKIIVYNIPEKKAVDYINGLYYSFGGDTTLLKEGFEKNLYLTPARNLCRVSYKPGMPGLYVSGNYINFLDTHILCLDHPARFLQAVARQKIDLLILSKNVRISITEAAVSLDLKQVVIDASVPAWQASRINNECNSLHIPCHDVSAKGAFVINLR